MQRLLACLLLILAAGVAGSPAGAVERTQDARDFAEYLAVCKAQPDERGLEGCVADQVDSKVNYLGDILAETDQSLTPAQSRQLKAAQKAFESYRDAACRFAVSAHDEKGGFDQLFCRLRLTNQRIADVLEGVDFLDQ